MYKRQAVICATTHTDKEDVGKLIEKYDLLAVPIVDKENRLVGIVTVDDAIIEEIGCEISLCQR